MTATQTPAPLFGLGTENTAYAKYFVGNSWLNMLTTEGVVSANVTFEPACRNNWHIHHKGGQILFVTDGRGRYREWGKPARALKHWHGAAKDSWFAHIALELPADGKSTEWCEVVSDAEYAELP